jgi:hypothetical protein
MALGYLPLLLVSLAGASWADAETVDVDRRGAVDLTPFVCQDITRSSLVNRVCYDAANRTMIVQLNSAYSQYCGVPEAARDSFLNAPSMGQYYNANIKGSGRQRRTNAGCGNSDGQVLYLHRRDKHRARARHRGGCYLFLASNQALG